jgi:intein-encoded DNA endonuclease-like protein
MKDYDFKKVIEIFENGEYSLRYICNSLDYDYKYVHRVLTRKMGYKLPDKKPLKNISKDKILEIYDLHLTGITITELSKKYNLDFMTIVGQFEKYNLNRYVFVENKKVNHTFFDTIDSEIKAYLLGFFCGDGTVNKTKSIALLLQSRDVEILNYYRDFIAPSNKLYFYKSKEITHQDRLKIIIHSSRIKESLLNHGIPENKTYNGFSSPDVFCKPDLYRHFIRGFFDADGSIYKSYRSTGFKITCTNTDFLDFCKNEFTKIGCFNIFFEDIKDNAANNLKISNKYSIALIKDYFYKDSNFYLKRKFDKFNELV